MSKHKKKKRENEEKYVIKKCAVKVLNNDKETKGI